MLKGERGGLQGDALRLAGQQILSHHPRGNRISVRKASSFHIPPGGFWWAFTDASSPSESIENNNPTARHKSCCTTQQIITWDASGWGRFFTSRNSTINGLCLPSNKIPSSQHWKSPPCTEPSHWLCSLQSKCGQSSSQLVGAGDKPGRQRGCRGTDVHPPWHQSQHIPAFLGPQSYSLHQSQHTPTCPGLLSSTWNPFYHLSYWWCCFRSSSPGQPLRCLCMGNKAATARVRNSTLPQTAALENPSSTFPHVTLHPVSNLQETKRPDGIIRGCETLGTSVIKTQTPKLRSSAIKQIILQLAGLPLMYLRTIFKWHKV